ncbi:MAG: hypothetical protein M1812_003074 [Candelaria pacifica]|nr:MAG: hypothetical protein M1812_003074 [Candelaria pacifica]
MSFLPIDLTTALRPSLLPDETLLFVQDGVGLYQSKFKLPDHQNGQVYLTSHRACYVDNEQPRKFSVAIDLRTVDRYELYAGFLKSSPKVTFYIKSSNPLSRVSQSTTPTPFLSRSNTVSPAFRGESPLQLPEPSPFKPPAANATWICPICSFSNSVPANFDHLTANAHTPLKACLNCGIKPPLAHVLKAAISSASNRHASAATQTPVQSQLASQPTPDKQDFGSNPGRDPASSAPSYVAPSSPLPCPRCTFLNHPSLLTCEVCSAPLQSPSKFQTLPERLVTQRAESPGPLLSTDTLMGGDTAESVKFSFRAGGEKVFHDRLKGAMVQRKWLLQGAPPVPRANQLPRSPVDGSFSEPAQVSSSEPLERQRRVGIAGLERRGFEVRKNNEFVIGNAFEDLEALMASAKEVVALAESFAARANPTLKSSSPEATALLSQSANVLGLVTTKDMLTSGAGSESLYLSELSRNLAEFLTDDSRGILRHEGGIMSLVDLWAIFNRARGGVELVSPMDFEKAAGLWETLKLPVRLRKFRSGLLVVQGGDWNDEKVLASLTAWLRELHWSPISADGVQWDWNQYGSGVTPQEVAERFGWSVGVASEELKMAEERGALCREEGVQGLKFWENWLLDGKDQVNSTGSLTEGIDALDI